jgi:hypothetical protein
MAGRNRAVLEVAPGERRRQLEDTCATHGSILVPVPRAGTSRPVLDAQSETLHRGQGAQAHSRACRAGTPRTPMPLPRGTSVIVPAPSSVVVLP